MYRILQVLNNNVAVVKTTKDEQAIAMGKGIIFNKKKGDLIQEEKVEKLFCLQSEESQENLFKLLDDIPLDFITTTYEIIDMGKKTYDVEIQDYIYVTLSGHIYWAYRRLLDDNYSVSMIPDMSDQFPKEYAIAKKALEIIEKNLNIIFPIEEEKNIALHFINAQGDGNITTTTEVSQVDIVSLVQHILEKHSIERTQDNRNYYDRLMIHLKYFIERIDNQEQSNSTFTEDMLDQFSQNYLKSTKIVDEISVNLNKKNEKIVINSNEKLYLIIHIQRLIQEESLKKEGNNNDI